MDVALSKFLKILSKKDPFDGVYGIKEILERIEKEKSMDIKEAHKMLKSFSMENKKILVFDNIKNQSQIEDIVSIDDIFASNGMTLIVTTRDSKTLKHCSKQVCKINIEELDEEINMKLFITHSCSQENLSNELVEVGKFFLRTCNGLLLSLKVMEAFFKDKKRL
uniref:Uncharacterized protein n=1 Tax=Physcomitrium patens TaxID=3218 RepID=A0A2K1JMV3_PHYPA|nr:hypothetical protein PHYPA_017706 [Physcomitrium patens]